MISSRVQGRSCFQMEKVLKGSSTMIRFMGKGLLRLWMGRWLGECGRTASWSKSIIDVLVNIDGLTGILIKIY